MENQNENSSKSNRGIFIALLLIILLLIAIIIGGVYFFLNNKPASNDPSSVEFGKLVSAEDIPDDIIGAPESENVSIVGKGEYRISKDQPNIYLENSEDNSGYLLKYDVSIDGKAVYESGFVPYSQAEPWDAYNNDAVPSGESEMSFVLHICDSNGTEITTSNVSGLTVIKQ